MVDMLLTRCIPDRNIVAFIMIHYKGTKSLKHLVVDVFDI
jgi:hypothetical protein